MSKVLVVATGRKTRGGITSVLKVFETTPMWNKFHCHWVQTHRDVVSWAKILYLLASMVDYVVRLPFYDIVHVHFSAYTTALRKKYFVMLAKLLHKKVIVHLHYGTRIDEFWTSNYRYLFSAADIGLLLSDTLRKRVRGHMGTEGDLRVCYNPCPHIPTLPVAVKKPIILFSGLLYAGKGYADLIKAFAKIADNFSDWQVFFAGDGEIEEGRALCRKLGIEQQTHFLGWISGEAKDKLFREASIFCLPSYAEGFPMAVLDAWAYGLPVITTPVGGIPDVAKDGENMLLFEPGDIDALASQIDRMIRDAALRDRIGIESLRFAAHEFNIDTITKQLADIYEELSMQK